MQEVLISKAAELRGAQAELQGPAAQVRDNGCGFSTDSATGVKGPGLLSIRERVGSIGGTVEFSNHPGMGAVVKVSVPMPCDNPANAD